MCKGVSQGYVRLENVPTRKCATIAMLQNPCPPIIANVTLYTPSYDTDPPVTSNQLESACVSLLIIEKQNSVGNTLGNTLGNNTLLRFFAQHDPSTRRREQDFVCTV